MSSDKERISKIIETLEHIRGRPAMFAGAKSVEAVGVLLNGFNIACSALGFDTTRAARRHAETERGWKSGAEAWAISQMRARGMTEDEMVDEMFAIEIRIWQLSAEPLPG